MGSRGSMNKIGYMPSLALEKATGSFQREAVLKNSVNGAGESGLLRVPNSPQVRVVSATRRASESIRQLPLMAGYRP